VNSAVRKTKIAGRRSPDAVDDAEDLDGLAVRMAEAGFLFREGFIVPIARVHGVASGACVKREGFQLRAVGVSRAPK
jgi:hypothetical protein